MTELSPAAQAVLDAANGACCYGPDDVLNDSRWIAAAALRAAVDEVAPEKTIEDIDYVHQSYVEGYKDALYEILIIANELEAPMTELSPATQKVLDAFRSSHTGPGCLAAALRAAADQLGDEMIVVGEGFKGLTRDDWRIVHVEDLLAIADELEAQ